MTRLHELATQIVLVNVACQMPRNIELILDECAIDDNTCLFIRDLVGPPSLNLLARRIEIAVNPIDADCERIDD